MSRTFGRLDTVHHLVARTRSGRFLRVSLLAADGSGEPYQHPGDEANGRYLKIPFEYWEQG